MNKRSDYDGAWKDLLHRRLKEVLCCYFPEVAQEINWHHLPVFLDQELRELSLAEEGSANRVDVLVKVQTLRGEVKLFYIHLEVQLQKDKDFAKRVAYSNFRIRVATGGRVTSLVILGDLDPQWKPTVYHDVELGSELRFEFSCCKLLEVLPRFKTELSLATIAAQAQIDALRTSRNPDKRLAARWRLARKLFQSGWRRLEVEEAFRFISWLLKLPSAHYLTYRNKLIAYQKENLMYTVPLTDVEEYAMEEGIQKGRKEARQETIIEFLKIRLGNISTNAEQAIRKVTDEQELSALLKIAATCTSEKELF